MGSEQGDGPKRSEDGTEDIADELLEALRSSTLNVPNHLSFRCIYRFSREGLTDPDDGVHILTDVREPSGRYRDGLLITSGGRATTLLLAGSDGKIGHGRILTENGKTSDVGPRPGWSTRDEWAKVAIKTAVHTLMRRNESRSPEFDSDRVQADEHLPLLEFKARTGCGIRLRSWRLADTTAVPDAEGARIEHWTGVLADGVITYAEIAAGYREDGTIAALGCVEGMPSGHDLAFLGVFTPDGAHLNMGPTAPGGHFLNVAVPLLAPYLTGGGRRR
jgi:hypothetical protein